MFTISIQAGGDSSRMGEDKALMQFLGVPLIKRVMDRISSSADEIIVTTNNPGRYRFLEVPLFSDVYPGKGALGGLHTALTFSNHPIVAVVACDLPFVNPSVLRACWDTLCETGADAVIPISYQGMEPLQAVYRRKSCLNYVEAALISGKRRMVAWHNHADVRTLPPEVIYDLDPRGNAFININTPESFLEAENLALKIEGNNDP
jgi:molybdopterin-guanine dinucleotide biosynthesis protein A